MAIQSVIITASVLCSLVFLVFHPWAYINARNKSVECITGMEVMCVAAKKVPT